MMSIFTPKVDDDINQRLAFSCDLIGEIVETRGHVLEKILQISFRHFKIAKTQPTR